jgi:hypothetical protein
LRQVVDEKVTVDAPEPTTKCLRNGALTCSPKFISSFHVCCRGQDAASKPHHCANTNVVHQARDASPQTGRGRQHNVWLRRLVCRQADGEERIKITLGRQLFPADRAWSLHNFLAPRHITSDDLKKAKLNTTQRFANSGLGLVNEK